MKAKPGFRSLFDIRNLLAQCVTKSPPIMPSSRPQLGSRWTTSRRPKPGAQWHEVAYQHAGQMLAYAAGLEHRQRLARARDLARATGGCRGAALGVVQHG